MPEGNSFLPRIESVFYAVFDIRQGSKIVYQVPEGLIAVHGNNSIPHTPSSDTHVQFPLQKSLFNFSDISMYVIPPPPLCGRLVSCSTRRHRIIGYPVELKGSYDRNYFRYNLCFVFDREADLSCYEPIVRKISQVLKSCEEESEFLSSPNTSPALHAILEQLYEDLNSYSETSIQIDQFNSIELKILPFYPNPPQVKDWMVPLPLINLSKRMEENWDLTMLKVCKHIDGVNHVSRIARLADCDITLTRQAISHLLYYQVIMTIDIFQYSNMYTLRKNIQWLADEAHVKEECGPYVTKPGMSIPDWPKLLHLYSRLKPGKAIIQWMKTYQVESLAIDVRRFTSFGVVKGFLRRVHRYPIYMPPDPSQPISSQLMYPFENSVDPFANSELARKRSKSQAIAGQHHVSTPVDSANTQSTTVFPTMGTDITTQGAVETTSTSSTTMSATHRARRASAAEKVLEQLRSREMQKSSSPAISNPRTSWLNFQQHDPLSGSATTTTTTAMPTATATTTVSSTQSTVSASVSSIATVTPSTIPQESPTKPRRLSLTTPAVPPPSPVLSKPTLTPSRHSRPTRPSSLVQAGQPIVGAPSPSILPSAQSTIPPAELIPLLDGDHHTDELSVKFEAGWPLLEQWLIAIGGGEGEGDYGRVAIIYK